MKKLLLLLFVFVMIKSMDAQLSNFIFFTEGGERFSVILNGILQNASPETNIKITGLNAPNYTVRVMFENSNLGDLQRQVMLNPGTETTYTIKRNKKGLFVFRYRSEVPIAQSAPPMPQQAAIAYTVIAPTPIANVTYSETTTTTVGGTNENVSMGLNIGGVGLNVNMNVNDGNMGGATSTTTTTYSTTTTTGGTGTAVYVEPAPAQVIYLPGYAGPVGCPAPMDAYAFSSVKQSIASKTFEDSKLTIAKQVINSNCLFSSQVKEIMMLFTFEDTRLELAKYAYGHTYDIGNYYQLNDAFDFESSIDELNNYINGGGF